MQTAIVSVERGGTGGITGAEAASNLSVIPTAQRGTANGVATLDNDSLIPAAQLPAATTDDYGAVRTSGDRAWFPPSPGAGSTILMIEDTAYFVFIRRVEEDTTPQFVRFVVTLGGTGAQTAEVGLFSTPLAPNHGGQELTKIEATGSVDDLTTTGQKENTGAFSTLVAAGTYLWAGVRTAMATNEPTVFSTGPDMGGFVLLRTLTAGALTASSTFTGAGVGNVAAPCPCLIVTLD